MRNFLANLVDALLYHIYWLVKVSPVLCTYWPVRLFFALCVVSMLAIGILDIDLIWYLRAGLIVAGASLASVALWAGIGTAR